MNNSQVFQRNLGPLGHGRALNNLKNVSARDGHWRGRDKETERQRDKGGEGSLDLRGVPCQKRLPCLIADVLHRIAWRPGRFISHA